MQCLFKRDKPFSLPLILYETFFWRRITVAQRGKIWCRYKCLTDGGTADQLQKLKQCVYVLLDSSYNLSVLYFTWQPQICFVHKYYVWFNKLIMLPFIISWFWLSPSHYPASVLTAPNLNELPRKHDLKRWFMSPCLDYVD